MPCHAALFNELVELQLERAVAVMSHPLVTLELEAGPESRLHINSMIARAMLANLDKASVDVIGERMHVDPDDLARLETQLAATQETERAPSHHPGYSAPLFLPLSPLLC